MNQKQLFPGQPLLNFCTSAVVLSFIPLEDAWIFAFSASLLLSETEFRMTSPSHLKWKSQARDQSCELREIYVNLQQGVWINWYQLWHFLSTSIALCHGVLKYMLSWWAGPSLSRERKTGIHQCLDINNELSWSIKSPQRVSLLLQSLILMTSTLWLVGMFAIIPLPMMRLETYVLHGLLKFWRLDPLSVWSWILHSLDPFVWYTVLTCFGNVFILNTMNRF